MGFDLAVPTLVGSLMRVEPLTPDHIDDLVRAAAEDRAAYNFTWVPSSREEVTEYVATQLDRLQAGELVPFASLRIADCRAVGSTSYFNFRTLPGASSPYAVEIGFTWLSASAQRSGINTEIKLLLLNHAFVEWGMERVDFKTDARNARSREALAGIGANFEGILRRWGPSWAPGESGLLRDSAMFSVVSSEWPAVERRLRERLRHHSAGRD